MLNDLLEHWLAAIPSETGWQIMECRDVGIVICFVACDEKAGLELHLGNDPYSKSLKC